jgi:hypothetical protein
MQNILGKCRQYTFITAFYISTEEGVFRMKKTKKLLGIIALFVVTGFALTVCDVGSDTTDGGTGYKSAGATVSAPTLATKTETSIEIYAVTEPSNGQTVEYAINGTDTAPASGWQDSLIFDGLTAGTAYYIFARSKANATHNAGAASTSLAVTTSTL